MLIRGVEFDIQLLPGARPISRTPYRMAPAELDGRAKEAVARVVGCHGLRSGIE